MKRKNESKALTVCDKERLYPGLVCYNGCVQRVSLFLKKRHEGEQKNKESKINEAKHMTDNCETGTIRIIIEAAEIREEQHGRPAGRWHAGSTRSWSLQWRYAEPSPDHPNLISLYLLLINQRAHTHTHTHRLKNDFSLSTKSSANSDLTLGVVVHIGLEAVLPVSP